MTLDDATTVLKTAGLYVNNQGGRLLIAASIKEEGGIRFCHDASHLWLRNGEGVAVFPSCGQLIYEVPGAIPHLVDLIIRVYQEHTRLGARLWQAVENIVPNLQQYLVGDSPEREPVSAAS